jgi:hypothetical protein
MTTLTLGAGDAVYVAGWTGIYDDATATVFTVRDYAARHGKDPDAAEADAVARGHEIVATIYTGSTLLGDRAAAARQNAEMKAKRAAAIELKNGQWVAIEGRLYTVRVVRGNEAGPRNSDPIKFTLEA